MRDEEMGEDPDVGLRRREESESRQAGAEVRVGGGRWRVESSWNGGGVRISTSKCKSIKMDENKIP
jgi:hypothetical protein